MPADKREVKVDILGDASSYKKAMTEAEQHTGKSGAAITGIFAGVGMAAANLAVEGIGKAIEFLGDSSKAAREDEVVTARLTTALQNNIKGFTGSADVMDKAITKAKALGFSDDEAAAALAKLVTVTKDSDKAQSDLSIAQDLARARGIDLSSATDMVVKAQLGNIGALKKQGMEVTAVTSAVDALKASHKSYTPEQLKAAQAADRRATAEAALTAITKAAGGQAETYAGTMQGSMARAGIMVETIQQNLGKTINNVAEAVIPSLVAGLGTVADWFGQVLQSVQPFIPVVQQLAGEVLGKLGAAFTSIIAAIQPMIPVVQEIAGQYIGMMVSAFQTVAGVITDTVIPVVVNVVKAVLPPLTAALKWIATDVVPSVAQAFQFVASKVIPLVSSGIGWIVKNVLPPLGEAFGWIVKNVLPPVVSAFKWVADNVLPALGTGFAFITDTVIPALSKAFQAVGGVIGGIMGGIGTVVKGSLNIVIGAINGIIGAINGIRVPAIDVGPVHYDGWGGFNIRKLPYLHSGGIVPGTPGSDVLAVLQAGERVTARGAIGGAGGGGLTIVFSGPVYGDGPFLDQLARSLAQRLALQGVN